MLSINKDCDVVQAMRQLPESLRNRCVNKYLESFNCLDAATLLVTGSQPYPEDVHQLMSHPNAVEVCALLVVAFSLTDLRSLVRVDVVHDFPLTELAFHVSEETPPDGPPQLAGVYLPQFLLLLAAAYILVRDP